MTDAPSPRCSSGSVDDFDAMSKQFTAWVATAANWKERYAGAAYSTRIKAAIVDLKWVIAQAEMHPEIGGAAQASAWHPIETAPKDGTWIIARCNDGSRLFRISWGRARNGDMCWCSSESIISYGDGLFSPNGGWTLCPTSALPSTDREGGK